MEGSRDTFYHYQELVAEGGIEALINRSRRTPNLKNRVDEATEKAVIESAVENPAFGQHRTSNELAKDVRPRLSLLLQIGKVS